MHVSITWSGNGLGFEIDPQADIVQSLRAAYQQIVGHELPLAGGLSVCDANVIVREAGIPAVAHGCGSTTAHADVEWVDVDGYRASLQNLFSGYSGLFWHGLDLSMTKAVLNPECKKRPHQEWGRIAYQTVATSFAASAG